MKLHISIYVITQNVVYITMSIRVTHTNMKKKTDKHIHTINLFVTSIVMDFFHYMYDMNFLIKC